MSSGWRTLKVGREIEARPPADVEQQFADEARKRDEHRSAAKQAKAAAELERRVAHAVVALERVREMVEHDRSATRFIARTCRWLRNLAADARRDS